MHIDRHLLEELGLDALGGDVCDLMMQHIYDQLEERVGMTLAQQMTDTQLDEFERFIDDDDRAGGLAWLDRHMPHYKQVAHAQFESLCREISSQAATILRFEQELAARSAHKR